MVAELRLCVPADDSWMRHIDPVHLPAAQYLLHIISQRRAGWHADRQGFVSLRCEYLRRLIGREALPVVRRLLADAGVIEWRRSYVPGERSMSYRLADTFQPSRFVTCRDAGLLRRVRRVYAAEDRRLLPVHRWLKSKLVALRIDVDRARSIVSGMVPDCDSGLDVETYRGLLSDQITAFGEQLEAGDVRLSCDEYGRVHTPLTNFPKSLRCCVSSIEGPLIGLDLSNSQPLFCGLVALKYVNASKQARQKLRTWKPSSTPYKRQSKAASHGNCSITMEQSAQPIVSDGSYDNRLLGPADLEEFLQLCVSGQLYESLMPPTAERGEFKRAMFRDVFFGADRHPSAIRDAFTARFPTVASVIDDLKSHDYRRLSWLMQWRESSLFIGIVCRRLMQERPDMPLVTIHDSVVTTADHISTVRAVLVDVFASLGVRPAFTLDDWSD